MSLTCQCNDAIGGPWKTRPDSTLPCSYVVGVAHLFPSFTFPLFPASTFSLQQGATGLGTKPGWQCNDAGSIYFGDTNLRVPWAVRPWLSFACSLGMSAPVSPFDTPKQETIMIKRWKYVVVSTVTYRRFYLHRWYRP